MENPCVTVTRAARTVRQLKIEGFSATESMDDDECIKSRWSVDGYDWEVLVCSNYYDIKLGLVFLSESRTGGTMASLCCQLIDPTGKIQPSEEKITSGNFCHPQESSRMDLVSRSDIQTSGYLRDDTLTVQCTVAVHKKLQVPFIPEEEVVAPPPPDLHQHLGALLERGRGADITFVVGDESFAAHKNILAERSPVFEAQFYGDMKEKCTRRVEIKDMEAEVFRAMLHFIYTDKVPEFDQPIEAVATMAMHLLVAADRYGLDRLRLLCEMKLNGGITVDTAAHTLALAEQHNFSRLKVDCVKFIVRTPEVLEAVLATEGFKHLHASCPSVLVELLKSACGKKN